MNFNKLQDERCPKYKCENREYRQFENPHKKLNYISQIDQYVCESCGFSIYGKNMPKFVENRTTNLSGETYQFLQHEIIDEIPQTTYYEAKHGEPMSDYQVITG